MAHLLAAALLCLLAAACGESTPTATPPGDVPITAGGLDTLRVLFVGNSLTAWNSMPGMVQALADSAGGRPLRVRSVARNGTALATHWATPAVRRILRDEGPWDVVVLQEAPYTGAEARSYLLEQARLFAAAGNAQVALLATWVPRGHADTAAVHRVREAAAWVAGAVGGVVIPAGNAWREALRRRPDVELYAPDGQHPGPLGSYTMALTVYQRLTGETPVGLPARLSLPAHLAPPDERRVEVPPGLAPVLQAAAAAANALYP